MPENSKIEVAEGAPALPLNAPPLPPHTPPAPAVAPAQPKMVIKPVADESEAKKLLHVLFIPQTLMGMIALTCVMVATTWLTDEGKGIIYTWPVVAMVGVWMMFMAFRLHRAIPGGFGIFAPVTEMGRLARLVLLIGAAPIALFIVEIPFACAGGEAIIKLLVAIFAIGVLPGLGFCLIKIREITTPSN